MDSNPVPGAQQHAEQSVREGSPAAVPASPFAPERDALFSESPAETYKQPEGFHLFGRWFLYIAIAVAMLLLLNSLLYRLPAASPDWLFWDLAGEIRLLLAAILPGLLMARIEGRPFGAFGIPAKNAFGRDFWTGALWGLGALTVLMLALRAFGVFSFGTLHLHGPRVLKLGLFYAVFFLIAALFEEFLMRGYSQWILAKAMGFWPAAAVLSIVFGAIHGLNPGEASVGLVAVVAIGFFFCLTLRRTGTLWWAVGFHAAWDWGESFLYSVPDSGNLARGHLLNSSLHGPSWLTGGSVGPEGSYLVFALMGALWLLFSRAHPGVKYES